MRISFNNLRNTLSKQKKYEYKTNNLETTHANHDAASSDRTEGPQAINTTKYNSFSPPLHITNIAPFIVKAGKIHSVLTAVLQL